MNIGKLLASGLLVGVMTLGVACQWLSPAATPTAEHKAVSPAVVRATAVARRTDSTPTYIWIPKHADPFMADKMINSYPATVVTLCTGIFGGAWSPNDPNYWETFDICAVNAQLGFPDPTDVATKGCVSKTSGCKKYQLKRLQTEDQPSGVQPAEKQPGTQPRDSELKDWTPQQHAAVDKAIEEAYGVFAKDLDECISELGEPDGGPFEDDLARYEAAITQSPYLECIRRKFSQN